MPGNRHRETFWFGDMTSQKLQDDIPRKPTFSPDGKVMKKGSLQRRMPEVVLSLPPFHEKPTNGSLGLPIQSCRGVRNVILKHLNKFFVSLDDVKYSVS